MFSHLSLKHFKSINSANIDLGALTVFVGPNSSGKSNIIDSIRFLHDAVHLDLDTAISSRQGFSSIRERTPQRPYDVRIAFRFKNERVEGSYSVVLTTLKAGAYAVKLEEGSWHGETLIPSRVEKRSYNFERKNSQVSYKRKRDGSISLNVHNLEDGSEINARGQISTPELVLRDMRSLQLHAEDSVDEDDVLPINAFLADAINSQVRNYEHYSIFPNAIRQPQKPVSEKRLNSTADNLTAVLKDMSTAQKRNSKAEVISALRRVEPDLVNISVKTVAEYLVPVFDFKDSKGRSFTFNVSQISDGTLRLLGLLVALYQPSAPKCMSIEEPEQNINPGALLVFADAVKDVSKKRQIFLTSHSPELLDQFEPENIVVVERDNARTRCGNMKAYQSKLVREGLFRVGELMKTEGLRVE